MRTFLAGATAFLLLAGCGGGEADEGASSASGEETGLTSDCVDVSGEEAPAVVALDNEFDPNCLGVAPGQDLTVRNDGAAAHTFTLREADINLVLQPGDEAVAEGVGDAVPEGGEIEFTCEFHPGMVGYLNLA